MTEIAFFFGIASRYSYLASTRLHAIEARHDCRFVWKPLYSGDLIRMRGVSPFDELAGGPVSGQYAWAYRHRDAVEWAAHYGVPFCEPDAALRERATPYRLALACTAAAHLGAVRPFCVRLFEAIFVRGAAEFGDRFLADLAAECGLPARAFVDTMAAPETARELSATTEAAFRRGAFGVPSFFIGERMWWGNDRLVLLESYLEKMWR